MAAIARFIMDTAKSAITAFNSPNEPEPLRPFRNPSPNNVLDVKWLLFNSFKLPLELVDTIIDYAEYWPCTTLTTEGKTFNIGGYGGAGSRVEDQLVLRSLPLYYQPDENNDPFTLPIAKYSAARPAAHDIGTSPAVQSTTQELYNRWEARSLVRTGQPCRKVIFTIISNDQGWSDNRRHWGTYQGSFTWFDVGLERLEAIDTERYTSKESVPPNFIPQFHLLPEGKIACDIRTLDPPIMQNNSDPSSYVFLHPFEPTGTRLQSNLTASKDAKEYVITWSSDDCIDPQSAEADALEEQGRGRHTGTGEFVRNLKFGDIITIWARARFPGWMNAVHEVKIDVYWVV